MMGEKSQVWIETAIYIMVGMGVIAIILATAMPQIKKIQDRSVIEQTKSAITNLDNKINEVEQNIGSVGISNFKLSKGKLVLDSENDSIKYILEDTPLEYSEKNTTIKEGGLKIRTEEYGSNFKIYLIKEYPNINFTYKGDEISKTLQAGTTPYKIQIANEGGSFAGKTHIKLDII